MPLVDLEATRQRLLRFGWIRDARVSRRLPDTLVVDIVERQPAAIWQHDQQLALIDMDGVVLEPVKLDAMPDLPLLIGPDANHQAGALARLVDAAPQLKPAMTGASWVGDRRWDIRFQTGETLVAARRRGCRAPRARPLRPDRPAEPAARQGLRPLRHAHTRQADRPACGGSGKRHPVDRAANASGK